MDVLDTLARFLSFLAGGYGLVFAAFGPQVNEGSWPRVSLFVIASLALVALPCGAPQAPAAALAASALLVERGRTFRVNALRSPLCVAPAALWLALAAGGFPSGLLGGIAAGGTLGAMLLGHSYLTARGLSFTPFLRMSMLLLAVLAARTLLAGALVWSWWPAHGGPPLGDTVFLLARALFGLALPLVFGAMVLACVKIRSNQSATGILYAMTALVGVGELIAVFLQRSAGIPA
ncbi:MAG: hypothetical protein ACT4PV_01570 [Planctomycetaceae bacterium]